MKVANELHFYLVGEFYIEIFGKTLFLSKSLHVLKTFLNRVKSHDWLPFPYPICVECLSIQNNFQNISWNLKRYTLSSAPILGKFYVPNLCRMLVVSILHRLGTGDNFKKCQNHFQSKIYPICVESLHIPICKHSTQIGYTKFFGIFWRCTQSV